MSAKDESVLMTNAALSELSAGPRSQEQQSRQSRSKSKGAGSRGADLPPFMPYAEKLSSTVIVGMRAS